MPKAESFRLHYRITEQMTSYIWLKHIKLKKNISCQLTFGQKLSCRDCIAPSTFTVRTEQLGLTCKKKTAVIRLLTRFYEQIKFTL
jgi:hypothetical protein